MFNLSSLAIIQKYVLLAAVMSTSATRLWLSSTDATDVTQAASSDGCVEGDVPDKVLTTNGENIQHSNELAIATGSGADDESSVATPYSLSPVVPPAASSGDVVNILII